MFQVINVYSGLHNILEAASFLKREGIILINSQLFPFSPMLVFQFPFALKEECKGAQGSSYSPNL